MTTDHGRSKHLVLLTLVLSFCLELGAAKSDVAQARIETLALFFEPNRGQASQTADFLGRAKGYTAYLRPSGLAVSMKTSSAVNEAAFHLRLVDADTQAPASLGARLQGHSNYFVGSDPAQWLTHVPHHSAVSYEQIYPGIDIVYYGKEGWLEYDFRVAPHADTQAIRLRYEGVERIQIDQHGDLLVQVNGHELRQKRPVVYQEAEAGEQEIEARYKLLSNGDVGFDLAAYDANHPLIIDPVLEYSTYVGAGLTDGCGSIVADATGNAFVAANRGSQVVVFKLDAAGSALLYLTELGGSNAEETGCQGSNIAIDAAGNAYVTGETSSNDFPTTAGAFDRQANGGDDLFVVRLNPDGAMAYGTYFGGSSGEDDPSVALGPQDSVYLVAETDSMNFPTTAGAYDTTFGGEADIIVAKLRLEGQGQADLLYSTYVGGSSNDEEPSLAVDPHGMVYVVAETELPGTFPTTPGAFDSSHNGEIDTVVFKVDPAGRGSQDLVYSTYFGGSGTDIRVSAGRGIALDVLGDVYIIGSTDSQNVPIPLTNGAFDRTFNGEVDTFIVKLRLGGQGANDLIFSTLIGGSGLDLGAGIFVDEARLIYFSADSDSENVPIPTVRPLQATSAGGIADIIMGVLSPDGSQLLFSSYLGGSGEDCCPDLFVDRVGRLYLVGDTASGNFPTTAGASDRTFGGGGYDSFVARIGELGVRMFSVSNASGTRPVLAPEAIASGFGLGLSDQVLPAGPGHEPSSRAALSVTGASIDLPTTLGNVSVRVTDSQGQTRQAQLFFVSPNQINYLVPAGTALGWAWVEVVKGNQVVARDGILIEGVSPGIYTANGSGSGVPLAFTLRFPGAGSPVQESVFGANGDPVPIDLGAATDQLFLILYGTGLRGAMNSATATVGGLAVPVAGPVALDQFVGLDQANLGPLPRTLIGRGQVEVKFTVDGKPANTVVVNFE